MKTIPLPRIALTGIFFLGMILTGSLPGSAPSPICRSASFLWDASRENMAGNADWVIDADRNAGQPPESDPDRYPSPSQSTVTQSTPESYWRGMNSEWAIRLVKAGHSVETLVRGETITFGESGNPQDLSNYNVLILNEPQEPLTTHEITAVSDFITSGGGVLFIADHCGSDRNHNGWDSPRIFNDMNTHARFGVMFYDDSMAHECDFTQNIFRVSESSTDPIIHGPFGSVSTIKFNGTTEIEIFPSINSTVTGHAWRNPGSIEDNQYMVATCLLGDGKAAFVPDSSPTSDGTGDPNDTSYGNTFSDPAFDNDTLFLNISAWLADGSPPRPTPTPGASPTPTPPIDDLHGINLQLNQTRYSTGDPFLLTAWCGNTGAGTTASLYIALEAGGTFWFYPSWSLTPDCESRYLGSGSVIEVTVFDFTWPDVDGFAAGLRFWGALLNPDQTLLGDWDRVEWGYE
ncbi:hypothetical protein JXA80_09115 [bacterium]|nr:hypothetical protein [candidate division CSSED10-310 bacterium]